MASRIVSTFSAAICLCAAAFGSNYLQLKKDFDSTKDAGARVALVRQFLNANPSLQQDDPDLAKAATSFCDDNGVDKAFEQDLDFRAQVETSQQSLQGTNVRGQIEQIKSSPFYRDSDKKSSNWLIAALDHLQNLFHFPEGSSQAALPVAGSGAFGMALEFILIGLFILAILVCIYLFVRHFTYKKGLRRKATALLEENEPERTADEWLRLADGLTSQGRFREAVRCLYLACLLRFDEAEVARFDRSQTNWEHLARIDASEKRPPALQFREPTQAFDLIWYGHRVRGIEDVDRFRAWYTEIVEALGRKAA